MDYRNPTRQCPAGSVTYIYQEGETLYTIARKFNTTTQAILAANPGINPLNLYGGQRICIPQRQPPTTTCPIGTSPYEVKRGDTLSSIARKFNTTIEAIQAANPNINPAGLSVGQKICITDKQPQPFTCPTLNSYVVRDGDTITSIAGAFNVTVQALQNANPGVNPNNLYEGLVLCLPIAPTPLGITVSIQTKRLTLYRRGTAVKTYPVAVGKPSTPSPVGTFTIINKQVNPGGPFGTRWLGLSKPHYGIHGTNRPESIGTAASNGCIRMLNRDVEELFNEVPVGTVVRIF